MGDVGKHPVRASHDACSVAWLDVAQESKKAVDHFLTKKNTLRVSQGILFAGGLT